MLPKGLILYENMLTPHQSQKLFEYINALKWDDALSRKVQHYGFTYDYLLREPHTKPLKKTTKPPRVLECLADILYKFKILTNYPNQIIVNRYLPGEGIGKHRDHHPIFGYDVATLSLGSPIVMRFEPYGKFKKKYRDISKGYIQDIPLKVGSILVFGGDARYEWSHEIQKRKTDIVDGHTIKRDIRISITFRHVNEEYQEK